MGVQVIAGSDAGSVRRGARPGFLYELELMERAGLPPFAVINAATGTGSKRLAFKEKFGQVKPGFLSRFILTGHSPSASISNFGNIGLLSSTARCLKAMKILIRAACERAL